MVSPEAPGETQSFLRKKKRKSVLPFLASGSSWHFLVSGRSLHSASMITLLSHLFCAVRSPAPLAWWSMWLYLIGLTWIIQDNLPILRFLITCAKSFFTIKNNIYRFQGWGCEYLLGGGHHLPSQWGFSSHAVMRVHWQSGECAAQRPALKFWC